jgi:hypothetical protein
MTGSWSFWVGVTKVDLRDEGKRNECAQFPTSFVFYFARRKTLLKRFAKKWHHGKKKQLHVSSLRRRRYRGGRW